MIHHTAIVDLSAMVAVSASIGEFVIIRPLVRLSPGVTVKARATIGEGVHVGEDTFIGPHSCICVWDTDGSHKPGLIGKDVYIGTGAIILPGVKIGDHVTIAAGSVVTRHCLEPGIYMGSPCRKA
jgi:acetyltransferase-like isoleucine patch superfamily enzyme